MRLVWTRAVAARTLLASAALAAAVTTVLLTGFLQYAYLLPEAGVRQAVTEADAFDRTLLLRAGSGGDAAGIAGRDTAARELLGDTLAGAPIEVYAAGHAIGQRLPDDQPGVDPGPHGAYALVSGATGVADHADLVTGAWPEPAGADQPVPVAVPESVAEPLSLAVGDEVAVVDEVGQQDQPVVVAGVWRARDPADAYWRLLPPPTGEGGFGPFLVHPDTFADRYARLATMEWLAVAAPGDLAAAGMPRVATQAQRLTEQVAEQGDDAGNPLDGGARLRTGLEDLADRLAQATVVNRSGLVMPAALLAVIAGYGLILVARLLAEHRRGENALLRARGASRRQLVRYTAGEALLVVAPAAVLGAPLGSKLVAAADDQAGTRSLGLAGDLAPYGLAGPPSAWLVAVVAALGCAIALALPAAARGRTWVAEQQERSRPGRAVAFQRAGVDLVLVAVAVLAWWQLRQYGSAVAPRDVGGLGVDPLLVAAPVVAVLAATAVALRLLPLATRLGVAVAGRRRSFPGLLGMWQADRRPHAGPVLLLVLAVATAVLAPAVASTWQQSQRDQAAQFVGADLRLAGTGPGAVAGVARLAELPEVTAVMPAQRTTLRLPEGDRVPLLAIDSTRAATVARLRDDLAPAGGPAAAFGLLHEGRPDPVGVALPAGATRLTGTVAFDAPRRVEAAFRTFSEVEFTQPVLGPRSLAPTIYLADEAGLVTSIRLDASPPPGGELALDVALPPGTTTLVGLATGLRPPPPEAVSDFFRERIDTAITPVAWRWRDLATVAGGDGAEATPVAVPDGWDVSIAPDQPAGGNLRRDSDTVTAEVDPQAPSGQTAMPFLLADPVPVPAVPVLLTPEALAATGREVGEEIQLDGLDPPLRIAGTVDALPGIADGQGLAVDLSWLALHQVRSMAETTVPDEWWLATADPASVRAAADGLPIEVIDRQETTDRLLDDPLGSGVLLTLWAAAAGGALLAAFGLAVDARANAVRRRRELAVLHTLGTSPPGLARALVVEQAVLAGLGVAAGAAVGVGVAAAMGTSLVLTADGAVPVPVPVLSVVPTQLLAPVAGLFVVAVLLGALVARQARREIAAGVLRIGED